MKDVNGVLIEQDPCPQPAIFTEVDISKLFSKPVTWQCYNEVVNAIADVDGDPVGCQIQPDTIT